MPRAARAGSSPKPMRHLMAGPFRSYFTIEVYGGAIRLPTVLYSLITGRSYCGTPSGYGGRAPRPRPPIAGGRVDTDPEPAINSGGAPDPAGPPRPPRPPAPPRPTFGPPRPPTGAVRNATSASTSPAARCGNAGIRPFPVVTTVRIAAASKRGPPATALFAGSAVAFTRGTP